MVGDLEAVANGCSEDQTWEQDKRLCSVVSRFCSTAGMQCFTLAVFFYEAAAYNAIFLGRVLPAEGKDGLVAPFMVMFNLAWGMAMWSYFQAHTTHPGGIPKQWQEFVVSMGDALPIA